MIELSILLVCFSSLSAVHARGTSKKRVIRANRQFDPDDSNAKFCDLPPYGNASTSFQPSEGVCSGENALTQSMSPETLQDMAEAYAPYLFFHPLETFTMSSVERTFENTAKGEIYRTSDKILFDNGLRPESLLATTREPNLSL